MTDYIRKHKRGVWLLVALLLLVPLFVFGQDVIDSGVDNSPNALQGHVGYPRLMCYDGATFDRATCQNTAGAIDVHAAGGAGAGTATPAYARVQDGDSTVLADVIDTLADNEALTLNRQVASCAVMGSDGAALDMVTVTGTALDVVDTSTRAGEDTVNDYRKVKKDEVTVSTPAKTTTVDTPAALTTILAAVEVTAWPNFCIYIDNIDGADAFTDIQIQTSPDDTTYLELTQSACSDTLAAGSMCVYCVSGNAYRYIRVQAIGNANPNEVDSDVWITMSKG